MKRLILLLAALAWAISDAMAARALPARGRVVDEQGKAVEYATVVLQKGTEQVAGMATDSEGRFELKVPTGAYTLTVQYLGYDPVRRELELRQQQDLGEIVLKSSATAIEGVVVKGQLIRREADRFIVDVANAPASIGKDGIELLERAPGVWIDNEKISINGKTGSKVFINDRELRMEPEQLLAYLRALRAEEIQKIEVVPVSGADQDADSSGGIIKITLRKRRENGVEGSLTMQTTQSGLQHNYSPGGNVSYHSGKLDLNASVWSWLGKVNVFTDEHTLYTGSDKELRSNSVRTEDDYNGGGTLGAIYEIDARNSVGGEFSFLHMDEQSDTPSSTDFMTEGTTHTGSHYTDLNRVTGYEATFNYIRKIDTLGSTFKVLGDFAHRTTRASSDNASRIEAPAPAPAVDSLYRDNTVSRYTVAGITLALEKKFSPRWTLRTGAKYTRNDMRNDALYEYLEEEAWTRNDEQSFEINYTENIAAAYGVVAANLGRWSFVAGLRGEYTHTYGRGEQIGQNYFSLFPNANISWSMDKEGAYSLIAQYARTISRPRFWCLTPRRMQISDYTYQTGNPELEPAYKHDVSVTLVLKRKYTVTGGVVIQTDEIEQTMQADADNPDRLCMAWVNFDTTKSYYLSASLPFQFTPWWSMNVNLNYIRQGQRVDQHAPENYQNMFFANGGTTFTLPANFFIDLSYRYQGRMEFGNCWVEPLHFLHAGIKKKFGEHFTASVTVRNLLDRKQRIGAAGEGFVRTVDMQQPWTARSYHIGLTYNFKAGKAFRRKAVEAGAGDDKKRL